MNFKEFLLENKMETFFKERTTKHIERVKKNALIIEGHILKLKGLVDQAEYHDKSKFEKPELDPYIILTWSKKEKTNLSDIQKKEINKATEYHVKHNRHHPEFHDTSDEPTINPLNRDKPLRLVDGTAMTDIDIAEMCCDWAAMSQELNQGNYKKWADNNVNKRWKFNENQVKLIYDILKIFL